MKVGQLLIVKNVAENTKIETVQLLAKLVINVRNQTTFKNNADLERESMT